MAALLDRIFNTEKMLKPSQKTGEPLPPGSEICSILLKTAWPSIVETFMLTLISLADVKMVSNLGKEAIAALFAEQAEWVLLLYQIFKDADALDRYRLSPRGPHPKYLRTDAAFDLLGFAQLLVARTHFRNLK